MYPGVIFSTPTVPSIMGADGVGLVVSPASPFHDKTVLIAPFVNWKSSPEGPDGSPKEPFGILGSVKQTGGRGTFAEYIVVEEENLVACPAHFLNRGVEGYAEAAAVPLGSLTAYRAVFTKANVQAGNNVLITGIGGGVALTALQYCIALGAKVWVSSSSEDKIARAVKLGAKGGVNYRDGEPFASSISHPADASATANWPKALAALMPASRPYLDAVIDSGGGPIMNSVTRVLKHGGIVSCYGSTSGVDVQVGMGAILKNLEFRGMSSLSHFCI